MSYLFVTFRNRVLHSALAQLIKRTKLLVWDEACMSNKHVAECVDRSLRDICSCDLPFGGKVIVFGCDFRQIPPIVKHGSRAEVVSSCLNRSYLWRHVKVLKLTINMRLQTLSSQDAHEVSKFSNFLLIPWIDHHIDPWSNTRLNEIFEYIKTYNVYQKKRTNIEYKTSYLIYNK